MGAIPGFLLRHTAVVEPYLGAGPFGDTYGPPVDVKCFAEDKRRRVLSTTGTRVVSNMTLICLPGTDIPPGSRVTVNGRSAAVINLADGDGGGLPTPDHVQVMLT
jgi:hypothetical protein